jgi:hypothetical protein
MAAAETELTPYLTELFLELPNNSTTGTRVQKLMFKIKMELEHNPNVQAILPYYWYEIGPFSEEVAAATSDMVDSGLLTLIPENNLLVLNRDKVVPFSLENTVTETIKQIANAFKFYDFYNYLKEIYYAYAPYRFIPLFKYEFLDNLKEYMATLQNNQTTLDQYLDIPASHYLKTLEDVLESCEANIPSDILFDRFKELFISFTVDMITLFTDTLDNGPNLTIYQSAADEAQKIWECFVSGVRILPQAHDLFYERKLDQWRREFYDKVDGLSVSLNKLTFKIVDAIGYDNSYPPEDERERHIIEAFLSWPSG